MSPTPRPDRISKDYEKEYPSIEIEGRRTVRKSPSKEKRNKSHVDNVKLETEVFNQLKPRYSVKLETEVFSQLTDRGSQSADRPRYSVS